MFLDIQNDAKRPLYRLAYDDIGNPNDRSPVFCVHGLGQTRHSFDVLAQELVKQNRRVIKVDMVGHGESDRAKDPSRYAIPFYAQDCAQIISRLGHDSIDWIGISMGGLVGIRAIAEQHIAVRHFIMVDVAPEVPIEFTAYLADWFAQDNSFPDKESFINWRCKCMQERGPMTDEQMRAVAAHDYRMDQDGAYIDAYDKAITVNLKKDAQAGLAWDDWALYEKIKCPTLVFHGEKSPVLTPALIERLKTTGPKAQIVDVEGVGHFPALSDEKQISIVSRFFQNKLPCGAAPAPPVIGDVVEPRRDFIVKNALSASNIDA